MHLKLIYKMCKNGKSMLSRSIGTLRLLQGTSWCARKFSRSTDAKSSQETSTTPNSATSESSSDAKGGFVKAMAKLEGHENFPKTIRFSPLVQMGDPQGKIVQGTIVHVVDDDLYIDFGAKFNCVCPRPQKNESAYTIGKKVRLMVHDLELSTRFLGASTDLTILEADCSLLGLARSNN